MTGSLATWNGGATKRDEIAQLGLWMFLATVGMLFAAFTSAYLVRQGGDDWTRIEVPPALWFSSAVLAASSVALEAGRWSGGLAHWRVAAVSMAGAFSLGAAFLVLQAVAWRSLMAAGVYLRSSPHGSFFYMLTAAHAAHVVAALAVLLWAATQTWNGTGRRDPRRWHTAMSTCRTFWHFLFGVWLYVFLLLSLG